jgi:hypothetical protein
MLDFFLKGHACKDPNASQDIEEKTDGSIQKGEMTASVQTEVATQREIKDCRVCHRKRCWVLRSSMILLEGSKTVGWN